MNLRIVRIKSEYFEEKPTVKLEVKEEDQTEVKVEDESYYFTINDPRFKLPAPIKHEIESESSSDEEEIVKKEVLPTPFVKHEEISIEKFECQICYLQFRRKVSLACHITNIHANYSDLESPAKTFCKICSKELLRSSIGRHMRNIHSNKPSFCEEFDCEFCEKTFSSKFYLQVHMMTHTKPFKCEKCAKKFSLKVQLQNHAKNPANCYKLHTKNQINEKFQCDFCKQTTKFKIGIKNHILEFHMNNEKTFKCRHCPKKFAVESYLRLHAMNHLKVIKKCKICHKVMLSSSMKFHVKNLHQNSRILRRFRRIKRGYKCEVCLKSFDYNCHLTNHMLTHTKPFKCVKCSKKFSRKDHLQSHLMKIRNCQNVHKKIKINQKFQCDFCDRSTNTKKAIANHIFEFHLNKEKIFKCLHCPNKYAVKNYLDMHLMSHFRYIKKCKICHKNFLTSSFPKHMKKTHKKSDFSYFKVTARIFCRICKKELLKTSIEQHLRMFHEPKKKILSNNFKCSVCHKTFAFHFYLNRHMLTHNQPLKCEICSKEFAKRKYLNRHLKRHKIQEIKTTLNLRPANPLTKCKICHKKMKLSSIQRHMNEIHEKSNFKSLTCHICNRNFHLNYQLKDHLKIHENLRNFKCKICSSAFNVKYYLKDHIKRTHKIRSQKLLQSLLEK